MTARGTPPTCKLCERPIGGYDPKVHRLSLDEVRTVDLCPECIVKLARWQRDLHARLFPTTLAKRRGQGR